MAENPPGMVPAYVVTRTQDSTMLAPQGGFQRSKLVYFALPDGTTSYVEVPLSAFTKSNVAKLIDAHVMQLLDVGTLVGPLVELPPG